MSGMFVKLAVTGMVIVGLAGCEKWLDTKAPGTVATASAPISKVSKPEPTKADWQAAVASAFQENNRKVDDDGNTNFTACFKLPGSDGKCPDGFMFGKYNPFEGYTSFKPAASGRNRFSMNDRYLESSVSIIDCRAPYITLIPDFRAKDWLFMNSMSVMADGEIVLKHNFDSARRDSGTWGVHEWGIWVLSDEDLAALRRFPEAKQILIRFSGERGYENVDKKDVPAIRKDISVTLLAYDKLHDAVTNHLPPPDAKGCEIK